MARKFLVRTFGCQMNEHDSERIAGLLEQRGMEQVDDIASADVVVLNTCCIRENADNKLYGHLGQLKALRDRRPDLQIAVGGCLAQKDGEEIRRRAPHVDVVFGTFNVTRAADLLDAALTEGPQVEVLAGAGDAGIDGTAASLPARRESEYSAWVTIQVGCDNSCAFCIVPSVRGPEVSRPFSEILSEVRSLAARGIVEVTLLGQNVNSFGRDLALRLRADAGSEDEQAALAGRRWAAESRKRVRPLFADLLREVGDVEGIKRVRFTSPHPKDLLPETVRAMSETPSVCEQLHLPLQSGSDQVLASMRRGYTAARYLERLGNARSAIADLAVSTDVIVGFPGETESDFEATLEVVAEAQYDSAYLFQFSPRPGTRAAGMTDQTIPKEIVSERFDRLKAVTERSALACNARRIGRDEEVLVEGRNRRDPSLASARTRQNKLVHFPAGEIVAGSFATVTITDAGAHHLRGELRGVIEGPRRRRIAVNAS